MLISDINVNKWYYMINIDRVVPIFVVAILSAAEKDCLMDTYNIYGRRSKDEIYKEERGWRIGYLLGENGISTSYLKDEAFDSIFKTELEAICALQTDMLQKLEASYARCNELTKKEGSK